MDCSFHSSLPLRHLLGGRAHRSCRPQTVLPWNALSACLRSCFCRDLFIQVQPDSLADGIPGLKGYMRCLVLSVMMQLNPPSLTVVTISSIFCATHRTTVCLSWPHVVNHSSAAVKLIGPHSVEDSVDDVSDPPSCDSDDLEFLYESLSSFALS